jgi:FkbM family methyltransferase
MRLVLKLRNQCQGFLRYFFNEGCLPHQNGELAVVTVFAPHCSRLVDIGANVGDWTASFLRLSDAATQAVVADPSTSALAALRTKFSQEPRVIIREAAFSDHEGLMDFFEEPGAGETSSLVAGFSRPDSRARVVAVTTLDREMERFGWKTIDFLKIDAEGHDLHVLRGASGLLAAGRIEVIQFEYNTPWKAAGSHLAEAIALLKRHDYRVYLIKHAGLVELECSDWMDFYDYSNFLAIRSGKPIPPGITVHKLKLSFW